MRNANTFEGMAASMSGHVNFDVMYDSQYGLVHRKRIGGDLAAQLGERVFLMETAENDIVVALHSSNLRAVYTGSSHTPKKPKRKHVKGTKPWTKIPYKFEDVAVGDVVCYTDMAKDFRHVVSSVSKALWEAIDGASSSPYWRPKEAYILKPYKEPVKTVDNLFSIGDKLLVTDTEDGFTYECLLVQTVGGVAQLICLDSGNRINDNRISFLHNVTAKQIQKYLGDIYKFEIMEDKQ